MNPKTKKNNKKRLYVAIVGVDLLTVGYVAYSYFQFSGSDIELAETVQGGKTDKTGENRPNTRTAEKEAQTAQKKGGKGEAV